MSAVDKQKQGNDNRDWGYEAESIAAEYFLREGYVIRERNWRMGRLEVDLILETDRTIVFVEVKARKGDNQDPADAVDRKKRMRIVNAADVYLRSMSVLYQYRFDIVTITGDRDKYTLRHYPDAYLPAVNGGLR